MVLLAQLFSHHYFTDPILRAPTLGSMLMCLAAGLVGALVFLRKQSLVGEALSHAAYPGVMAGVIIAGFFSINEFDSFVLSLLILSCAFVGCTIGLFIIHLLERKFKVKSDAALCFVLSAFFGIGLTMASEIQFSFTPLYKQAQIYLYGQAATMTDIHIAIYGILSTIIACTIWLLYKEIQVIAFDRIYAKSIGINVRLLDALLFVLIVLAVVVGIRSVGVVLMSAMLIAPPVAARQFTNRLSVLITLSGLFGLISGFLGNYFSVEFSDILSATYTGKRLALPTGPMIVMVASMICLGALLFAPNRGLLLRACRIAKFRYRCMGENLLKAIWRMSPSEAVTFDQIYRTQDISRIYLQFILWQLRRQGWLERDKEGRYKLTQDGSFQAANIVRLHRLWEVYLVEYMGAPAEKVHRNAEEMEHIITPELEKELTILLKNPKLDPHLQPIPSKERL